MMESSFEAPSAESAPEASKKKYFSLSEAQRALPLVSRIVGDIRKAYGQAVELEQAYSATADRGGSATELEQIEQQREGIVDRMNALTEELAEIGCELKDWEAGLCDFPAIRDGREVSLCWKAGETAIEYWHETHAGFGGRQPVDDQM